MKDCPFARSRGKEGKVMEGRGTIRHDGEMKGKNPDSNRRRGETKKRREKTLSPGM